MIYCSEILKIWRSDKWKKFGKKCEKEKQYYLASAIYLTSTTPSSANKCYHKLAEQLAEAGMKTTSSNLLKIAEDRSAVILRKMLFKPRARLNERNFLMFYKKLYDIYENSNRNPRACDSFVHSKFPKVFENVIKDLPTENVTSEIWKWFIKDFFITTSFSALYKFRHPKKA